MQLQLNPSRLTLALMLASLTGLLGALPAEAAPAKLRLTKSQWTASKQSLAITGKLSNASVGASVELYGLDGRLLGTPPLSNKGAFSLILLCHISIQRHLSASGVRFLGLSPQIMPPADNVRQFFSGELSTWQ